MDSELKDLASVPAASADARPLLKPEPELPVSSLTIEDMEKKYAAFVRNDVYGAMGRGEFPWPEKLLLGLGLMFLLPMRVLTAMTLLVFYYVICRICTTFIDPNREDDQEDYAHVGGWRRAVIVQIGRFLARVVLFVFGFYWISEITLGSEVDAQLNTEV